MQRRAQALGGLGAARHARHVRIVASAYSAGHLAQDWRETSAASAAPVNPGRQAGGSAAGAPLAGVYQGGPLDASLLLGGGRGGADDLHPSAPREGGEVNQYDFVARRWRCGQEDPAPHGLARGVGFPHPFNAQQAHAGYLARARSPACPIWRWLRQANGCGLTMDARAGSRTDPDGTERHTGICSDPG